MVSIKYIAKMAGVSTATVSRVMNKTKPVSPALEKKVLDAVIKYKYYPNSIARSLAYNRSFMICIMLEKNINHFQSLLLPKFTNAINQLGYHAIISIVGDTFEQKIKSMEELESQHIDGVIALFYMEEMDAKRLKATIHLPFIYSEPLVQSISYYEMNKKASYKAIEYLITLGHKKIGGLFKTDHNKNSYMSARYEGFIQAMEDYHLPMNEHFIAKGIADMKSSDMLIDQIFNHFDKPTALFCVSDELAIGAMFHLSQLGYNIPKDVSIIGYDGIPMGEQISPRLTTIQQPYDFWCEQMISSLVATIEKRQPPYISEDEIKAHQPYLLIRDSCTKIS